MPTGPGPAGQVGLPGRIWLVGMMGSGKTSVGRALAGLLERPFVDTDQLVEDLAGMSVAELFAAEGEEAFRQREAELIRQLAEGPAPGVLSVGGGAPGREQNRRVMRSSGAVVWLRATPEVLVRRLGRGEGRPVLGGPAGPEALLARVRELVELRRPWYEDCADVVLDVGEGLARDVAERVAEALARRAAAGSVATHGEQGAATLG